MKIIRVGTIKPKQEDMIAECPECQCVFTFGEHESKRYPNNGGGSVFFVRCPQCGGRGSYFDTGYPGKNDKDRELDRRVKEEQARLRALILAPPASHIG